MRWQVTLIHLGNISMAKDKSQSSLINEESIGFLEDVKKVNHASLP